MRACVLIAVVAFGVLVVPALARADPGPSTTEQVLQQAGAAMNSAQALASQEIAATSSAVSAATAGTPASASVPTSVASAESEATKAVSEVIATVQASAASSSASSSPAAVQTPVSPPAPQPPRHRAVLAPHHAARKGSAPWSDRAAWSTSATRAIRLAPPVASPRAAARVGGPATQHRRPVPHRLPPRPLPPQGLGGSAEATGSGTPAPLLVAALGAALLVILFESLSRLLPRSAFRKPRRLALPPWHPG